MSNVGKDVGKMFTRMFKPGYQGQQESYVQLAAPSEKELEYLRQYEELSKQLNSLPNTMALSGQDKALLDQAFASGQANLRRQGQIYGQDLAGTRGLNTSDTPVSDSVLRELLPAQAQMESDKASSEMGLGLQLRGLEAQKLNALINANMNLANREQQDRYTTAKHYGNFQQTANANGMQNASQFFGSVGQGLGLIGSIGSVFTGGGAGAALGAASAGTGLGLSPQSQGRLNTGVPNDPFKMPSWMNQYR
ncbi:MAG: hypothetical protein ABT940_03565 [Alphaproteobacteria bacterium]